VAAEVAKITGEKGLHVTENTVVPDAARMSAVDIVNPAIVGRVMPTADNVHTLSFDELVELDNHIIDGFTEVAKSELIGVPHAITGLTFWYPKKNVDGTMQRGFVAVECTVGSVRMLEAALAREWIPGKSKIDELIFSPNERILYNDGSTGIRRQLVEILETAHLIDVGHRDIEDKSRLDKSWLEWESFTQTTTQGTDAHGEPVIVPSFKTNPNGAPLVIIVPRGLMVSNYTNDYTDEGTTYYLR
jgi:hypothetical protein